MQYYKEMYSDRWIDDGRVRNGRIFSAYRYLYFESSTDARNVPHNFEFICETIERMFIYLSIMADVRFKNEINLKVGYDVDGTINDYEKKPLIIMGVVEEFVKVLEDDAIVIGNINDKYNFTFTTNCSMILKIDTNHMIFNHEIKGIEHITFNFIKLLNTKIYNEKGYSFESKVPLERDLQNEIFNIKTRKMKPYEIATHTYSYESNLRDIANKCFGNIEMKELTLWSGIDLW